MRDIGLLPNLGFYLPHAPELLDTNWMVEFDRRGVAHSEMYHADPVLRRGEVSLAALLDGDGVCAECAERSLAEGGSVRRMFVRQLPALGRLLELPDDPLIGDEPAHHRAAQLTATVWAGYNRTVCPPLYRRVIEEHALPRLRARQPELQRDVVTRERALVTALAPRGRPLPVLGLDAAPSLLVALSASDLHHSRQHREEHLALAEMAATFFVFASRRNSVWLLHVPGWASRYGVVLERGVTIDEELREAVGVFVSFCDDAARFGGWEPLAYWWETSRLLVRV